VSERKDKTPVQVSDEDYKVAPTSSDEKELNKKDTKTRVTGENYDTGNSYGDLGWVVI